MSSERYIGNELELFSHADNWKRYWSSKLSPLIESPVLEVGAGIGTNTLLLNGESKKWLCLEPDSEHICEIVKLAPGVESVCGTLADLPSERRFKSILYIDVLEHIEDDADEIQTAFNKLEAGGRLIILSPAHQRLFSPFDKAVGHFRRYDRASMMALTPQMKGVNVKVHSVFYLDSVGCLASWANSLLLKQSMPTRKQIWLWDKIMVPLSRVLDGLFAFKLGKTIVIVWER